jgi:hypothetical protein
MKNIKQIIIDNQDEFNEMIINFFTEKMDDEPRVIKPKQNRKATKTVCHFDALGKSYKSNVFTDNYSKFLVDVSHKYKYDVFKRNLRTFVQKHESDFSENTLRKVNMVKLKCGGFVSTHSSTQMKMEHITSLCEDIGVKVIYDIK